jgi:ABC-type multidrug transport system fused ATPase/permease subunit
MFSVIKNILSLLTGKERRQLFWLSLAIVLMGLVEVAGIASIMPFMAVVGNPEVVEKNQWINWFYRSGGFTSTDSFLVFLGFFVLFVIVASNIFKAATTWFELKFVNYRTCSLSRRLFFHYLTQPYVFYLNQNTSLLGKNLLQEVFQFIHSVLKPATEIFSKLVVVCFIFGLLLMVDPPLAVLIVSILGGAYALLYCLVQKRLARLGEERFDANAQRFKTTGEALGGIKDLKILGREPVFFEKFSIHARQMAGNMTSHQIISQLPRFVMEVLSFGGILIIVLYYLMIKEDVGQTLPILALYALAGYRLMPALQGIFSAATTVRFNLAALDALLVDLSGIADLPPSWMQAQVSALPFQKQIRLAGITFTYPGAAGPVIRNLDLTIEKNTSVGFVGATGSGKTTTVDILLGLLTPQEGGLQVDGVQVAIENLPGWQRNLGYVPQSIFLCDDTVANNIAFGVSSDAIDMAAVERAARVANLHDFVVNELPEGYATNVGERGVRLSGGQRQRIGIARALYHDPDVLIMDEATSALDGITEEAVIQAIRNLAGKKTIVTIAHRLTTLRDCDVIYVMDNGRVTEQGTYSELIHTSDRFKAMARTEKPELKSQCLSAASGVLVD